jgi:hypothetical protein
MTTYRRQQVAVAFIAFWTTLLILSVIYGTDAWVLLVGAFFIGYELNGYLYRRS